MAYQHNLGRLRGHRFLVQPLRQGVPAPWTGLRFYPIFQQQLDLVGARSGPWDVEGTERWEKELDDGLRSRRVRWKIASSIWAHRKQSSNSGDYCKSSTYPHPASNATASAGNDLTPLKSVGSGGLASDGCVMCPDNRLEWLSDETSSAMRRTFLEDFDMAMKEHGLDRALMHWAAASLGDTTGKWRRANSSLR